MNNFYALHNSLRRFESSIENRMENSIGSDCSKYTEQNALKRHAQVMKK